jgi:hypothetical protein
MDVAVQRPCFPECAWLYDNYEFASLQQRPMGTLVEALEFAIGYVDASTAIR